MELSYHTCIILSEIFHFHHYSTSEHPPQFLVNIFPFPCGKMSFRLPKKLFVIEFDLYLLQIFFPWLHTALKRCTSGRRPERPQAPSVLTSTALLNTIQVQRTPGIPQVGIHLANPSQENSSHLLISPGFP